jgi:small conductance mechanosensitive channel
MENFDYYLQKLMAWCVAFAPNLIVAVIIFIAGIVLIKIFRRFMTKLMLKNEHDPTVLKFLMDLLTWVFRVVLIVSVVTKLGVPNTSFVAIIGAAGLAIGLSLQGSLSNFAGGLLIILFKPFRVGDYIEAQNQEGTVNSIQIFSTRLVTSNNQIIYLPNGALSNGTIKNFSQEPVRRADITISVDYSVDLKRVKAILYTIIENDKRILNEPKPSVIAKDLADTAIRLSVHLWSLTGNYGDVISDFYESIKEAFDAAAIDRPSPKTEVYLKK